ncbi:phosphonate metabolism protein/1,5-bisphosphokinase (PRPP-forming) PhnN [Pseudomonas lalucatii]|uniref:Ribose 1,5-bisphosphate phosphokinase PhnN n=1 Tax=Pseudomonas lalucatii TaxID=1424203 RepID=A0ABS5Q2Z1_9PSED|nr:phosphonate metabolism protein/1,5-bisphosphokinase (PRPP-forming) PhnN [Pseudomonas lalucatii]MBS7663131.1 phosphonate metabolism protein/1,5-bisphosphokinase (PRPP-forming) PhnN [Pseudomonas lalucatii]MBS7724845.1 phosphonate metabolism protein/1,5-bisphosphokinase (PRPP-forming) PhnN [Pseudomonas lalucatii]
MAGRLIYLMGPSGSGKDSVLQAARGPLAARGCRIARRVITRSAEALGEEALSLSPAQFEAQERAGAFAMSWRANGLAYGIPRQIDEWLAGGEDVLVNGSRAYLAEARRRYPDLLAVVLTVDLAVLRQRLLARGRETPSEIEARLARNAQFGGAAAELERLYLLDNSGALARTVDQLLGLIEASRSGA